MITAVSTQKPVSERTKKLFERSLKSRKYWAIVVVLCRSGVAVEMAHALAKIWSSDCPGSIRTRSEQAVIDKVLKPLQ